MKKLLLSLFAFLMACGINAQPDEVFTTFNGTLNLGGNNTTYENNLYKFYTIVPVGASTVKLAFNFCEFGLFSNDYLYVYDGPDDCSPLIGIYNTLNYPPDTITSTGYCLSVYCITDDIDGGENGWSAYYTGVRPVPKVYTDLQGSFTDGFENVEQINYQFYSFAYLIKPTGASTIKLSFPFLTVDPSSQYIWIYDGVDETAPLIACNNYSQNYTLPSNIQSSGNSIYIFYKIDGYGYGNWTAQYTGISQNQEVTFDYDASGNRLHRNLIILPTTKSAPAKPAKQPDKKQPDKPYKDKSGNADITIYPNPTSGELKVEIANFDFTQKTAIYVFSPSGKLIIQKSPATGTDIINLTNDANGLYLMKIVLGDKTSEWKILKE